MTSERRVGPAEIPRPVMVEGIDVARGPGSVAYGSDAIGGVISVRTRRAEPKSPLKARVTATGAGGTPKAGSASRWPKASLAVVSSFKRTFEMLTITRGRPVRCSTPGRRTGASSSTPATRSGRGLPGAWQSDFGRDVERPRNNSRTLSASITPSRIRTASLHHYEITWVGAFGRWLSRAWAPSEQRTDQDRFAIATTGRSLERADMAANDFQIKGGADRSRGGPRRVRPRCNGRFGLEARDIIQASTPPGALRAIDHVSVEDARRT